MTYGLPGDPLEWMRLVSAIFGITAFGLLTYRLISRWPFMSWLSWSVTFLLTASVLVIGLGSARAEQLDAPFNELAPVGLFVNLGATIVGFLWHRLLDPDRVRI